MFSSYFYGQRLMLACVVLLANQPPNPRCREQPGASASVWNAVQAVAAPSPGLLKADPLGTWQDFAVACQRQFIASLRVLPAQDRPEAISYYVSQFGRHDALADFRWLCGQHRFMLPDASDAHAAFVAPDGKWMLPVRDLVCQRIVERCLTDRRFLARYYHAVVWSRRFVNTPGEPGRDTLLNQNVRVGSAFSSTAEMLQRFGAARRGEWWWWARNAVLLIFAFGHDDVLAKANPDELAAKFFQLRGTVQERFAELRADNTQFQWVLDPKRQRRAHMAPDEDGEVVLPLMRIPRAPLPDWGEIVPPDTGIFEDVLLWNGEDGKETTRSGPEECLRRCELSREAADVDRRAGFQDRHLTEWRHWPFRIQRCQDWPSQGRFSHIRRGRY